jgi:hypothetical protein
MASTTKPSAPVSSSDPVKRHLGATGGPSSRPGRARSFPRSRHCFARPDPAIASCQPAGRSSTLEQLLPALRNHVGSQQYSLAHASCSVYGGARRALSAASLNASRASSVRCYSCASRPKTRSPRASHLRSTAPSRPPLALTPLSPPRSGRRRCFPLLPRLTPDFRLFRRRPPDSSYAHNKLPSADNYLSPTPCSARIPPLVPGPASPAYTSLRLDRREATVRSPNAAAFAGAFTPLRRACAPPRRHRLLTASTGQAIRGRAILPTLVHASEQGARGDLSSFAPLSSSAYPLHEEVPVVRSLPPIASRADVRRDGDRN